MPGCAPCVPHLLGLEHGVVGGEGGAGLVADVTRALERHGGQVPGQAAQPAAGPRDQGVPATHTHRQPGRGKGQSGREGEREWVSE